MRMHENKKRVIRDPNGQGHAIWKWNYEYTNNELIRHYYKSSIIHNSIKHLPSPSTLTVVLNI